MPDVMFPKLFDDKQFIEKYFQKKKTKDLTSDVLSVDGWSLEKIHSFEE
jgi:hypothetical protein